jgi:hypothetical protein
VDGHRTGAGHEDGDATGPHPAAAWSGVAKSEERANGCATNAEGVAAEGDVAAAIGPAVGRDDVSGRSDGDAGTREDESARRDTDLSSPVAAPSRTDAASAESHVTGTLAHVTRTLAMCLLRVAMWLPPAPLATPFGKMMTHSLPMAIPPRLTGIRPSDPVTSAASYVEAVGREVSRPRVQRPRSRPMATPPRRA